MSELFKLHLRVAAAVVSALLGYWLGFVVVGPKVYYWFYR